MENVRRRRFRAWYKATYGEDCAEARAKFMADTQLTKGRVSQFFDDDQPFGERAAANLADRLGLGFDYFERDHSYAKNPADPDFVVRNDGLTAVYAKTVDNLREIERLNPQNFAALVEQINKFTEGLKATDELLRGRHQVTGYVSPERAADALKRPPGTGEAGLLGGSSQFGALDNPSPAPAPAPRTSKVGKR